MSHWNFDSISHFSLDDGKFFIKRRRLIAKVSIFVWPFFILMNSTWFQVWYSAVSNGKCSAPADYSDGFSVAGELAWFTRCRTKNAVTRSRWTSGSTTDCQLMYVYQANVALKNVIYSFETTSTNLKMTLVCMGIGRVFISLRNWNVLKCASTQLLF